MSRLISLAGHQALNRPPGGCNLDSLRDIWLMKLRFAFIAQRTT
jgi:hypothetical protein